jgi:hypothetical protein
VGSQAPDRSELTPDKQDAVPEGGKGMHGRKQKMFGSHAETAKQVCRNELAVRGAGFILCTVLVISLQAIFARFRGSFHLCRRWPPD